MGDFLNRPTGHRPPVRKAKYGLGDSLRTHHGFVGAVDVIYVDYWAAVNSFAVSEGWFECQEKQHSTKDQVFYSLVAFDGHGNVLVGEAAAVAV